MSAPDHLPRPALRRQIEQTLASHPEGIPATMLRHELTAHARAFGGAPVGPHQLMRQLGLMLIEGHIDERDGVWHLVDARAQAAARTRTRAA